MFSGEFRGCWFKNKCPALPPNLSHNGESPAKLPRTPFSSTYEKKYHMTCFLGTIPRACTCTCTCTCTWYFPGSPTKCPTVVHLVGVPKTRVGTGFPCTVLVTAHRPALNTGIVNCTKRSTSSSLQRARAQVIFIPHSPWQAFGAIPTSAPMFVQRCQ